MPEQFAPQTDKQAGEFVAWAAAEQARLAIQGSASKAGFGHPVSADALLSLRDLSGIIEYEPAELVMKVRAGTPLAEVETALAGNGQRLAFEPPRLGRLYGTDRNRDGTIGGVFMGNLSGPRRFVSGAARDHILGIGAINGRGEHYKSGGTVIKNVTGYDLSKLLAGSWGTLSVVTEISFKVLPEPPASATLVVSNLNGMEAFEVMHKLAGSDCEATGLACLPVSVRPGSRAPLRADGNLVLLRLEGSPDSIRERIDTIAGLLPAAAGQSLLQDQASERLWNDIRDVEVFADAGRYPVLMKLSLPPALALDVSRVIDQLDGCEWFADAAGGWIWMAVCQAGSEDKINTIRREVAAASGSAVLYRAPEEVKRKVGLFSEQAPALLALQRRLRHSFDPQQILNPGRLGPD